MSDTAFPPPVRRPLAVEHIRPDNSAVLVIDMQNDFIEPNADSPAPHGRVILPAVNRLTGWARTHGLPIVMTHEMHRADHSDFGIELEFEPAHCLEGTNGWKLVDDLDVAPDDVMVYGKRRYDAFMGTDLHLVLRTRGVENLICCGTLSHVCVMNTVFTARNLDFRVLVPDDAVYTKSRAHHDAAMLCISDVFATVTTVEEITALWTA